jgi:hypothetical protein
MNPLIQSASDPPIGVSDCYSRPDSRDAGRIKNQNSY